jgi:hypothetical protein
MMVMVMKVKCSGLKKEEREKQNWIKAKVIFIEPFYFDDQDT